MRSWMISLLLLLVRLGMVLSKENLAASADLPDAQTTEHEYVLGENDAAENPLDIGSMTEEDGYDSPRHRQEKAHLMKRMERARGTYNTVHPRYRLLEALYALSVYRERSIEELDRWRTLYKSVGKQQKKTLEKVVKYTQKLDDIEALISTNSAVCESISAHAMLFYNIDQKELDEHIKLATDTGRRGDKMSVSQTLKHYIRDWADEGAKEREEAFPCILTTLKTLQAENASATPLKVLFPGSGLGRLGHEVASLPGFEVTINEWSMYMNIGYRYLTSLGPKSPLTIHPFIDSMSHHATTSDMLRSVSAPNTALNPSVLLVEGDFNTAFADKAGHFDILVTHFFIDTARNLMAYFDAIHRLLRPGGRWLNFGPLLYGTGPFVQLSLDEIVAVVEAMGFVFEDTGEICGEVTFEGGKVRSKQAEYGFNGRALTRNAYLAQMWVVRKV
ncbi:hypothetical protein ACN47E_000731 [Coniothyrium glycines]